MQNGDKQSATRRQALRRGAITGGTVLTGLSLIVTAKASREINESTTIDEPGEYQIGSDIDADGTCIEIEASDVTIDGNGHTLYGNGSGIGIELLPYIHRSLTVRNVTIRNFETGVRIGDWSSGNSFESVTIDDSTGDGVFVASDSGIKCEQCTIQNNAGYGIRNTGRGIGNEIIIKRSTLQNNGDSPIFSLTSTSTKITDCVVANNGGAIGLPPYPGSAVENTEITNNEQGGIRTSGSDIIDLDERIPVLNCTIRANDGPGIEHNSGFLDIRNCEIEGNQEGYINSGGGRPQKAVLRHNNIENNVFGVLIEHTRYNPVDAKCNYWGHSTGPDHEDNPRNNPKGQPVSDRVEFKPWSVREIRDDEGNCVGGRGNGSDGRGKDGRGNGGQGGGNSGRGNGNGNGGGSGRGNGR